MGKIHEQKIRKSKKLTNENILRKHYYILLVKKLLNSLTQMESFLDTFNFTSLSKSEV